MRKRTTALIFDFGNVVAHFDYRKACTTLGRPLGLSGEALLKRAWSLGFLPLVQQYESGKISAETFSRGLCALVGLEISHDDFAAAWTDIFSLNAPIAGLVEALKGQGYTLVLGSNTNDLHATQFRRQFATTLAHFDRLILSYEIGHIKPSAAFYHACSQAAGVPPGLCVFIDDIAENVAGAQAVGMEAVLFRDVPSLLETLRELGIEVAESRP
jgi:putative hydrolase of the HAD superfamily